MIESIIWLSHALPWAYAFLECRAMAGSLLSQAGRPAAGLRLRFGAQGRRAYAQAPPTRRPSRPRPLRPRLWDHWWTLYDDAQLTGLVEEALKNSLDAKDAFSKLAQAIEGRAPLGRNGATRRATSAPRSPS